jgi:hypothetical protein
MFGQCTFPDAKHIPAGEAQGAIHHPVAGFVAGQFLLPECPVVCRLGRMLGTAMPEAAVNEDCRARFEKNKIRAHGKLRVDC